MSEHNPWKTLDSKVVYENDWIRVREDAVVRPDGKEGIYGVVETRIAVGVVPLTAKGDVVLVGQFRYAMNEYSWEIIEGGSDGNEIPLETARRELQEEAGIVAKKWTRLGEDIHLSNCHSSEIGVIYLAEELEEIEAAPEGTEVLQNKTLPFEEVMRMVEDGEIKDSLSLLGMYRAAKLLAERSSGAQESSKA